MISGTVNAAGEVVALGRRFWAPQLAEKRGWEVELHFDRGDDALPSVWTKGRMHRICTVARMADLDHSDFGFFDRDSAAAVGREIYAMREKARCDVVASKIQALVDLIDHRIEARCDKRAPGVLGRVALAADNIYRRLRGAFLHDFSGEDMAEQQLLDRRDVILELGEIIFGNGHRNLRAVDAEQPIPADPAIHSLSETSK